MYELVDYLDIEKGTVEILRDYLDKEWKIKTHEERELSAESRLDQLAGYFGSDFEDRLCGSIDRKIAAERGHTQALSYMRDFRPCWERLSDCEREILTVCYVEETDGKGIGNLMKKYSISKGDAYKKRSQALKRLVGLIFWKK
jgi:hypothetical protein